MEKPLAWLKGEIKTPPFSTGARVEAGYLLRRLQRGQRFGLPHSRPMPAIGIRCHELRIRDRDHTWRILYRVDRDAILVLDIFDQEDCHDAKDGHWRLPTATETLRPTRGER